MIILHKSVKNMNSQILSEFLNHSKHASYDMTILSSRQEKTFAKNGEKRSKIKRSRHTDIRLAIQPSYLTLKDRMHLRVEENTLLNYP